MDARRARSAPARTLALCREGLGGRLRFRSPPPWRIKRARRRRNVFENRVIYPLLHGFLFADICRRYATDALFSAHFLHFNCTFSTASATSAIFLFPLILPYFMPVCQSRCASGLGDGICFHDAHCGISDWWLNRQAAKKQTLPLWKPRGRRLIPPGGMRGVRRWELGVGSWEGGVRSGGEDRRCRSGAVRGIGRAGRGGGKC